MNRENTIDNQKKPRKGFRLELFNFFIMLFTVILTISMIVIVTHAGSAYGRFYEATETYIACQSAAEEARNASEYLTTEIRYFVRTGDRVHLDNYFYECKVEKRREKAIETIQSHVNDPDKAEFLDNAVNLSKQLMQIDFYAIRLTLEANGAEYQSYPEPIKVVTLSSEDAALSKAEKLRLANDKVQNSEYNGYKEQINNNVALYLKDLLKDTRATGQESSALFTTLQNIQLLLFVFIIFMLIFTVLLTSFFLIRPLRKSAKEILMHHSLPVKGPMEIRTLAVLYNKALENTQTRQDKLSHDASHDALTGIQNRIIFESMCHTVSSTTDTAIVLMDIDNFKYINDNFGHDVGDGVLQKLAKLLRASFRSDDILCRIGGDEFCVIMQDVSYFQREQITKKMQFLMDNLGVATDNLPAASVSIGVAFGEAQCSFNDLYKRADDALYGVKSTTKNGIKVYGAQ